MKIALLFASKPGREVSRPRCFDRSWEEEEDPPPDLYAECDPEETIRAVQQVLKELYEVHPIESDEKAYDQLKRLKPQLVFHMAKMRGELIPYES